MILTKDSSMEERVEVVIDAYKKASGATSALKDTEVFSYLKEMYPLLKTVGVKGIDFPYFILLHNYSVENAARYMRF